MKKTIITICAAILFTGLVNSAGQVIGTVSNLDSGKNEITINVKSGVNLKIGDRLEVESNGRTIILEVKYPMQTISFCKIKGKGKLSDLMNGISVYRHSKNQAGGPKAGDIKIIGNMEFIYVEGGTFKMGSEWPTGEDCERPVHDVTLDGFWMGKYEVTQKQYKEIMDENPSRKKKENLPVSNVRWKDADDFCKEFSTRYNIKARLPYEAEWEYACRAGTTTKYYWGDKMNGDYCWNRDNADDKHHPGGKKKPNAFGLYDMGGNVMEWCMDCYDEEFYKKSPEKNPFCTKKSSGLRVLRGGAVIGFSDGYIRSGYRFRLMPNVSLYSTGFRVVVER